MGDHYTMRCRECRFPMSQCECKPKSVRKPGTGTDYAAPLYDIRRKAQADGVVAVADTTPIVAHQLLHQVWNAIKVSNDLLGALARLDVVLSALAREDVGLVFAAEKRAMDIMEKEDDG